MKKHLKALALLLIVSMTGAAAAYFVDSDPKGDTSAPEVIAMIACMGLFLWIVLGGMYLAVQQALKGLITIRDLKIIAVSSIALTTLWMVRIDVIYARWEMILIAPFYLIPMFVLHFIVLCTGKFIWGQLKTTRS